MPALSNPMKLLIVLIIWALLNCGWQSYEDSAHKVVSDNFSTYHATVYMYGTGFVRDELYTIKFYDGSQTIVQTEQATAYTGVGKLDATHQITDSDIPGQWSSKVFLTDLVAQDDFYVEPSAVPEMTNLFMTVLILLGCYGIYRWRRK